jgi:hypothetical protein
VHHPRLIDAGVAVDHHAGFGVLLVLQAGGMEGAVLPIWGDKGHDAEVGLELQPIPVEQ